MRHCEADNGGRGNLFLEYGRTFNEELLRVLRVKLSVLCGKNSNHNVHKGSTMFTKIFYRWTRLKDNG